MSHDAPDSEVKPTKLVNSECRPDAFGPIERTIPDADTVFAVNGRAAANPARRLVGMRAVETLDAPVSIRGEWNFGGAAKS